MPRQRPQHLVDLGPGRQLAVTVDEAVGQDFREAHRKGLVKDPHDPARVVAYLCLAGTQRNGAILEIGRRSMREVLAADKAAVELTEYFAGLLARRRAEPRDDLVSVLAGMVPAQRVGLAIGVTQMVFPVGNSIGPLLGSGLIEFVGLRGMATPELAVHVKRYREAWREAGHPGDGDVCLRIPVYAAPTEKAALEEPKETIMYYFQRQADLTRAPVGRAGTGPAERRITQARTLSSLSYPEILSTKVAFGTGPALVDRFAQLREELSLNGVAAELNPGGLLPMEQEKRSLELLTQQVMPRFK